MSDNDKSDKAEATDKGRADKERRTAAKVQAAALDLERAQWEALATRGEAAMMPRKLVAAIRSGFNFCQLVDFDLDRMANLRAIMVLTVDSYAQDRARGVKASA